MAVHPRKEIRRKQSAAAIGSRLLHDEGDARNAQGQQQPGDRAPEYLQGPVPAAGEEKRVSEAACRTCMGRRSGDGHRWSMGVYLGTRRL